MKNAFLLLVMLGLGLSVTVSGQTITVVTPNGGEHWALGSTQAIAWTPSPALSGNVRINLIKDNGDAVGTIAEDIAVGSSPYSWKVGQLKSNVAVPPGTDYKIRVRVIDNPAFDESNGVFSIEPVLLHPVEKIPGVITLPPPNLTVCITDCKTAPVFGDRDIHVWIKNNNSFVTPYLKLEFYIEGKGTNWYSVSPLGSKEVRQFTRNCKWSTSGNKTVRAKVSLKPQGSSPLAEVEGVIIIYLHDPTYQGEYLVKCSDGTNQNEPVL